MQTHGETTTTTTTVLLIYYIIVLTSAKITEVVQIFRFARVIKYQSVG